MKNITIFILLLMTLAFAGCDDYHWFWQDDWAEHEAASGAEPVEELGVAFQNNTGVDLLVVYDLDEENEVTVEAIVKDGLSYEFESGVTQFFLYAN